MAKNTKKPAVNHGKTITSFFARNSKQPSSQDIPRSSTDRKPTKSSSAVDKSILKANVPGAILERVPNTPIKDVAPLAASPLQQANMPKSPQASLTSSNSGSLKRPRSPDSQPISEPTSSKLPEKPSPLRRRTKGANDQDIVRTNKTPNAMTSKKARLSPEEEPGTIIPSSQHEEQELTLKGGNPIRPGTKSQERAIPLTPDGDCQSDKMLVDSEWTPQPCQETLSTTKMKPSDRNAKKSLTPADQMLTPPLSELSSIPPTPIIVNTDQKIAQLRAAVYADTLPSPESSPAEFKEELESSSDEEDLPAALTKLTNNTGKNSGLPVNEPARPPPRYSLRNRSLPSPTEGSRRKPTTKQLAQNKNTSPTRAPARNQKQKPKFNPFTALLREKRAADKHGVGDDDFRRAEMTAQRLKNKDPLDDMDLDDEDDVDWDSAARSARDMQALFQEASSSKNGAKNDSSLKGIDEEERKAFLGVIKGKGTGKGLVDILEQDKVGEKATSLETQSGIRLWSSLNDNRDPPNVEVGMSSRDTIPLFQITGDDAVIRLYNTALQRNDLSEVKLLLDMDFLCLISSSERSAVASSMCEVVLSPQPNVLGDSATRALEKFWNSSSEPMSSAISFSQIKKAMLELGAEASVLSAQNWSISSCCDLKTVDLPQKSAIIARLIRMIESCARSQRLAKPGVPNITVALLLLGMDSEASSESLEDITRVVDLTCNCIPMEDTGLAYNLCVKILRCAESYEPMNKARLVSLLSAGSGVTRRIASVVAHCFITDKQCPRKESLFSLPPLFPIIDQLIPDVDTPGKFSLLEHTNYDDIGHYTFILGVAITDIKDHVIEERKSRVPSRFGEKPQTDLQVVRSALEALHNKISDTRAAHLERSRAKAAIKVLSMALHYQREYFIRNDPDNQSKTLTDYFTKKDK